MGGLRNDGAHPWAAISLGFLDNAVAVAVAIGVGVVLYLVLVLALRVISREDLELMPKGRETCKDSAHSLK